MSSIDCFVIVSQPFSVACIFAYSMTIILPIMLALCLMLSGTYYVQNYASIIGWCLLISVLFQDYQYPWISKDSKPVHNIPDEAERTSYIKNKQHFNRIDLKKDLPIRPRTCEVLTAAF